MQDWLTGRPRRVFGVWGREGSGRVGFTHGRWRRYCFLPVIRRPFLEDRFAAIVIRREASSWAEKGLWQQPNSAGAARVAAASHALAGRLDQAHKAIARLRQIDPTFRVSDLRQQPFRRPEDLARYEGGLRKAGLPE
jgi:hypothetical protein